MELNSFVILNGFCIESLLDILNSNGRKLLEFCKAHSLRLCNGRYGDDKGVGKFTYVGHNGRSVIDYVIMSQTLIQNITQFYVGEPNILSDHCSIHFSLKMFQQNDSAEHQINPKEYINKKYVWDSEKSDSYTYNLNANETSFVNLQHQLSEAISGEDINRNLRDFTNLMDTVCDPLFTKKINVNKSSVDSNSSLSNKQPWFDQDCAEARKQFYADLDQFRLDKTLQNQNKLSQARRNFKQIIRRKRWAYDKLKTEKLIVSRKSNVKEYWRMLKRAANVGTKSTISSDSFSKYFQSINNPNDRFYQADEDILFFNERYVNSEFQIMFEELNIPIAYSEVLLAVKQLKNGAGAGPDLLLNEFYKKGTNILTNYIHSLFNKIFELGYFPDKWSEGFIVPIFKKGDKNEPSNYRGITLLSTLGKLFTRVLNNRLNEWAEKYRIYCEAQAGFRQNMGTIDNLFVLNSLITHFLNQKKQLFCVFIDFTKAFDYVVRDNLWYKLIKAGVRGRMLDIIKSIYSIVKSQVKHNSTLSDGFFSTIGVRQGECLSPFLFSIYLNDLEAVMEIKGLEGIDIGMLKLFILLYADDIVLFGNSAAELQNAIVILEEYCQKWKLTVNTSKTKVLIFRKGGRLPNGLRFTYNGTEIEIVSKFSYLGIVFTSGGSCKEVQRTLAGQASKAIFVLNKYLYKFTFLKPSIILDLFDKLISPILNYGSEVWGFSKAPAIEAVHLNFCKNYLA